MPELQETLFKQSLSVSKASRVVAILNKENASEVLEYASTHTTREIDLFVASINPLAMRHDRIKPISKSYFQLSASVSAEVAEKIERAKSLSGKSDLSGLLDSVLEEYLERHDPVRKAERAAKRQEAKQTHAQNETDNPIIEAQAATSQTRKVIVKRKPLPAKVFHAVNGRDRGRCTFHDVTGKRCENDRWLEAHHIKQLSRGGSDEPQNLTTLCSFHHDLVHQLSLPIDGEFNWLPRPLN